MTLNVGEIIGALVGGGITGAVMFTMVEASNRAQSRLSVLELVAGAFVGNFLWGLIFKKSA